MNYLRIEGVNHAHCIDDTEDLSTRRGGGLMLLNATDLSANEMCALSERHGGVCVPAHINRGANGMLGALGLMPSSP